MTCDSDSTLTTRQRVGQINVEQGKSEMQLLVRPEKSEKYRGEHVCLSLCLLANFRNPTSELHQILCMFSVSVSAARCSSGGIAIR